MSSDPFPSNRPIVLNDEDSVRRWAERLGVTVDVLRAAADAVGPMPAALATYLTSRGAPRKVVTDAMRAAGRPKRNRQSWRRQPNPPQSS